MTKAYSYPLDYDWDKSEIYLVMNLWQAIEKAYEIGIKQEILMQTYQGFKQVIPSIGEEKKLGKEFESVSGYSLYQTIQQGKKQKPGTIIKMEGKA